jgi:hypothetical protein
MTISIILYIRVDSDRLRVVSDYDKPEETQTS